MITAAASILLAYLLGSIPASVIVTRRARGFDIRDRGSGNAGAANVLRVVGWRAALLVVALDVAKGWLAVRLAALATAGWARTDEVALAAGLAALAGHLWPAWAGFRGGKGVAVSAGAVLAIDPVAFLACTAVFALVAALTRRISAASIAAALALPLYLVVDRFRGDPPGSTSRVGFGILVAAAIVLAHRDNLRRMRAGTEPRIAGSERR